MVDRLYPKDAVRHPYKTKAMKQQEAKEAAEIAKKKKEKQEAKIAESKRQQMDSQKSRLFETAEEKTQRLADSIKKVKNLQNAFKLDVKKTGKKSVSLQGTKEQGALQSGEQGAENDAPESKTVEQDAPEGQSTATSEQAPNVGAERRGSTQESENSTELNTGAQPRASQLSVHRLSATTESSEKPMQSRTEPLSDPLQMGTLLEQGVQQALDVDPDQLDDD